MEIVKKCNTGKLIEKWFIVTKAHQCRQTVHVYIMLIIMLLLEYILKGFFFVAMHMVIATNISTTRCKQIYAE